ncbi:MAG: DUF1963 domain-containing protein [Hamadaea sp.]|uniref:DUF1963 domain-containing protein n=1 Tax=Hamadaea sp. TaxID=2024425 RepID=UPI0017D36197|nr:DUF1963 domain-containing protein [Hamadaea sp.]NUR72325.1 DUF1963 domain-containing protein [Hamadaea sp.]NUT18699.1 DUF1963 domain-containing protein [Hamadaea sp.]
MIMLDAFRAAAQQQAMPHDDIEWWLRLARPCLYLSRDGSGPVVGYFGGRPALPATVVWPEGMVHLATLDLAAVPHGSTDLDLPADGALLFFAAPSMTSTVGRVIHVPAGAAVVEAEPPGSTVYDRFPLHANADWSLPGDPTDSPEYRHDRPDEDEYIDIVWYLDRPEAALILGGYGTSNTGGLGVPVRSPEIEVLLAQFYLGEVEVGEDFETDLATVFYVIGRDDLAAALFDRVSMSTDFHG